MSEIMRPLSFAQLMEWMRGEYARSASLFGVRREKMFFPRSGRGVTLLGRRLASPLGPAAGPHAQLAQNIVAAYLAGSRFMELKTVQVMDGEELRKCVARPCINAADECYNVEWSTELTVPEAFEEYVKAWFILHVLSKELEIGSPAEGADFIFNMSVGYSLDGIKSAKLDAYLEGMKNAESTSVWKTCRAWLAANLGGFRRFTQADLDAIPAEVSGSVTVSTLHGCPKEEIERIAAYLLTEKRLHTYVKCNPTLLGYQDARAILDRMGFRYVSFDDHHFRDDLQYADAVAMFARLQKTAREAGLAFGVKLTNTFPVEIKRGELPGAEMYMSGRSLFPLSLTVASRLAREFNGKMPISYSGGIDFFNLEAVLATGIRPLTFATTLLKPGGYERIWQLAVMAENAVDPAQNTIDVERLDALAAALPEMERFQKGYRAGGGRKTASPLPLFDCFKAPCKDGGCPIHQQIPAYLEKTAAGDYAGAFSVIARDNPAPSITGAICNHECQQKCTRVDYDDPLAIREVKRLAAEKAQDAYIEDLEASRLKTAKSAGIVGAGPAGIAAAVYLRRNGVPVTVYEKRDAPFGVVRHVIPEFRIAQAAIERDYRLALKHGVEFEFGVEVSSLDALRAKHAFVVLAVGAWKAGGDEAFLDALDFLERSKKSGLSLDLGKSVAVIGGGDVAMDCARAARRNRGVQKVTIVYRRTVSEMPAQKEEYDLALADGVEVAELLAPVSFKDRQLVCEVQELGDYDRKGRRTIHGTGKRVTLSFDTVIGATGARVDTALFAQAGLRLDERGNLELGAANETSLADVYAAGDCKAGPATVVRAMADSKAAAAGILRKLGLPCDFEGALPPAASKTQAEIYAKKGVLMPRGEVGNEGHRCLSCQQCCEVCAEVCPNRANVAVEAGGFAQPRQIVHIDRLCNECGNCGVFCPHAGLPYKDKFTVFSSDEDFAESENAGFLAEDGGGYKVRLADKSVVRWKPGERSIPPQAESIIEAVAQNYAYLLTERR